MPVRLLIWKTPFGRHTKINSSARSRGFYTKPTMAFMRTGLRPWDMEVADMDKTDIDSYSLADINVEFPNPSIAVITYKTSQRRTFDGKDVSGNYYNESVWVKKGNRWLNTFHTAIKAK
jgi:hypothetical protein